MARDDDAGRVAEQSPRGVRISFARFTQEARVVLPAAPYRRRVQVLVPETGQTVHVDEDREVGTAPDGSARPGAIGRNRAYKLPTFPSGQQIEFCLAPGQWLIGMVDQGTLKVSFVVEPEPVG